MKLSWSTVWEFQERLSQSWALEDNAVLRNLQTSMKELTRKHWDLPPPAEQMSSRVFPGIETLCEGDRLAVPTPPAQLPELMPSVPLGQKPCPLPAWPNGAVPKAQAQAHQHEGASPEPRTEDCSLGGQRLEMRAACPLVRSGFLLHGNTCPGTLGHSSTQTRMSGVHVSCAAILNTAPGTLSLLHLLWTAALEQKDAPRPASPLGPQHQALPGFMTERRHFERHQATRCPLSATPLSRRTTWHGRSPGGTRLAALQPQMAAGCFLLMFYFYFIFLASGPWEILNGELGPIKASGGS
ncbi:uncharacterized protein LOC100997776 isoform X2 [Papio anubis]|nr:uncharacterized protein LOC100997776 isoform X2 [Papio anubis]